MARRVRMSPVDTAWLRMDSPANLMMIVGVWTLKPGIRYEDLCRRVEERLLKYARFRQRVPGRGARRHAPDPGLDDDGASGLRRRRRRG